MKNIQSKIFLFVPAEYTEHAMMFGARKTGNPMQMYIYENNEYKEYLTNLYNPSSFHLSIGGNFVFNQKITKTIDL